MSVRCASHHFGASRQSLYQRRAAIRTVAEALGPQHGRDGLFALLPQHGQLVVSKRQYTKTTDLHQRFRQHPNRVKDAPPPTAANQCWVSYITHLPTRQGTLYRNLVTDATPAKSSEPMSTPA